MSIVAYEKKLAVSGSFSIQGSAALAKGLESEEAVTVTVCGKGIDKRKLRRLECIAKTCYKYGKLEDCFSGLTDKAVRNYSSWRKLRQQRLNEN